MSDYETFQKRDLGRIWAKLLVVINPIRPMKSDARKKEIRNCKIMNFSLNIHLGDLWGPFLFCLMLAV